MKSSESRLAFEAAKLWLRPRVCHSAKNFRENKELEDFPQHSIRSSSKNISFKLISNAHDHYFRSHDRDRRSDHKGHNGQWPQYKMEMTSISVNDLFVVSGLGTNKIYKIYSVLFEFEFLSVLQNKWWKIWLTLTKQIFTKDFTLI